MTKSKIRVAFIGAGKMASKVHYPSLASFPDVEISAVCDLDSKRLQEIADQYQIEKRYTDYRRMVEEVTPDAVYAIGPPNYMYDVWVWLLEHKQNLFIEKPMGVTMHQAEILAHLAEKNACITQVGFQRRTCPILVKLREECLKRGPIHHALCRFYKCSPVPFHNSLGRMMDDGVHAIDTIRWICGGEVVRIQSCTRRLGTPDVNLYMAMIEFDNGSIGTLVNSWVSGRRIFDVEMHARGICSEVELENQGWIYADSDTQGVLYDTREVSGGEDLYVFGGFQAKNREFIDCVKSRKQPGSNFADAIKTMRVAETILANAL